MRIFDALGNWELGDFTISPDGLTATIVPNAVTDAKLRDSAALSVIGRSANSVGDPADIVAANAGEILRRYANVVGFGSTMEGNTTWDDNAEVRLGTGGDLRLFHDGTDSTIQNDTGLLFVRVVGGTIVFEYSTTRLRAYVPIRLPGYTVATLPAGAAGDTAYVTDALAPVFLGTVVGGGAVTCPVFFDGANWVVS
jgi:hypothetical protein